MTVTLVMPLAIFYMTIWEEILIHGEIELILIQYLGSVIDLSLQNPQDSPSL